jgi:uncharacterized membrane protein
MAVPKECDKHVRLLMNGASPMPFISENTHAASKPTIERLAAFSDGVFAVSITIMVLDLKPPEHPTFAALWPLWPTALSYMVSYIFVAIVWLNHHYLLRFTEELAPRLIWINFAHLFAVSLVPFTTAWVADTRFAAAPVFVYATTLFSSNWHILFSSTTR